MDRKAVDSLAELIEDIEGRVHRVEKRISEIRMGLVIASGRIAGLAEPVPEGYVHAPGCVRRSSGWHTCDPIPEGSPGADAPGG